MFKFIQRIITGRNHAKSPASDPTAPANKTASSKPSQQELNSLLITAAATGHTEDVKTLLAAGADVHARVHIGWFHYVDSPSDPVWSYDEPLKQASENGHLETMKVLLKSGANVNSSDRFLKNSPIARAATKGQASAVSELVAAGADVHVNNDQALREAAENGHTGTVIALLGSGADVHAISQERDWNGRPFKLSDEALLKAAENGHTQTVQTLLNAGADPNGWNEPLIHEGIMSRAASKGHNDVVELLQAAGAIEPPKQQSFEELMVASREAAEWDSTLTKAAKYGRTERVSELLAGRPESYYEGRNLKYKDFGDALLEASRYGHTEVVKLLLASGEKAFEEDLATSNAGKDVLEIMFKGASLWPIENALKEADDLGYKETAAVLRETLTRHEAALKDIEAAPPAEKGAGHGGYDAPTRNGLGPRSARTHFRM